MSKSVSIVIVGAGIIGTQCALQLRAKKPNATITVIDKSPFSYDGASSGNMGGFAACEVQPLATLGNVARGLGWMMNPLAPFTLRFSCIPVLRSWLFGFVKAAVTPGHYAHVVKAQETLMTRAYDAHLEVIGDTQLRDLISDEGALAVYKNPKRMQKDWNKRWKLFRARGEACRILDACELRQTLPDLDPEITHAIHIPAVRHWANPATLLAGLHDLARDHGTLIQTGEVTGVEFTENRASGIRLSDGKIIPFDYLIVAAGAWSKAICAALGDRVPLDSERGYATTIPACGVKIRNLLLFPDDEFVATPMTVGLRLGGTVELASLEAPPNYQRTDALAQLIKDYFPTIDTSERTVWMGHRPSIPDGLPVIGVSPKASHIFYAFGHGHVGVTQSAITGKLIAQSLCCETTDVDLAPFNIGRFE